MSEQSEYVGEHGSYEPERCGEWYHAWLLGFLEAAEAMQLGLSFASFDDPIRDAFRDAYREGYVDGMRSMKEDD